MSIKRKILLVDIDSPEWKENPTKCFHEAASKAVMQGESTLHGISFVVDDEVYKFCTKEWVIGQRYSLYNISSVIPSKLSNWPIDAGQLAKESSLEQVGLGEATYGETGKSVTTHFHNSADFNATHNVAGREYRVKTLKPAPFLAHIMGS